MKKKLSALLALVMLATALLGGTVTTFAAGGVTAGIPIIRVLTWPQQMTDGKISVISGADDIAPTLEPGSTYYYAIRNMENEDIVDQAEIDPADYEFSFTPIDGSQNVIDSMQLVFAPHYRSSDNSTTDKYFLEVKLSETVEGLVTMEGIYTVSTAGIALHRRTMIGEDGIVVGTASEATAPVVTATTAIDRFATWPQQKNEDGFVMAMSGGNKNTSIVGPGSSVYFALRDANDDDFTDQLSLNPSQFTIEFTPSDGKETIVGGAIVYETHYSSSSQVETPKYFLRIDFTNNMTEDYMPVNGTLVLKVDGAQVLSQTIKGEGSYAVAMQK